MCNVANAFTKCRLPAARPTLPGRGARFFVGWANDHFNNLPFRK